MDIKTHFEQFIWTWIGVASYEARSRIVTTEDAEAFLKEAWEAKRAGKPARQFGEKWVALKDRKSEE
jgi:hypothetical protein